MPDTAETAHITAPRSMAHLLRTTLMAVGILSLLLSVVGAALLFQHAFAEQFDTDLSRTVEAITVGYEHSADPQPEQLAQYADGLRLTLVAQDGTVLYDSATADPSTLPNHANRPEIQQAMAEGTGASVRRSATLGYDTHYYAVRLTDGSRQLLIATRLGMAIRFDENDTTACCPFWWLGASLSSFWRWCWRRSLPSIWCSPSPEWRSTWTASRPMCRMRS